MPRRRPTRTTLRGWTRGLPLLAACFGLMFLFAWLEGQRLDNEYRAHALTEEILEVNSTIQKLRGRRHHLNRMDRMEQEAPDLFLIEANPGQIVIIRGGLRRETLAPTDSRLSERGVLPPTRSVVFRLSAQEAGTAVTPLHDGVARMESDQVPLR